jgi:hypothetical protein
VVDGGKEQMRISLLPIAVRRHGLVGNGHDNYHTEVFDVPSGALEERKGESGLTNLFCISSSLYQGNARFFGCVGRNLCKRGELMKFDRMMTQPFPVQQSETVK